jgi:hypothetical protein
MKTLLATICLYAVAACFAVTGQAQESVEWTGKYSREFSPGKHTIDTIVLPAHIGGFLRGASSGSYKNPLHPNLVGDATYLMFNPTAKNGIEVRGADWTIEDLTLVNQSNDSASIGLLMAKPSKDVGLGVGGHKIRNLNYHGYTTAIQIAEKVTDGNCDTSVWETVTFDTCGRGVVIKNTMGMDHRFRGVESKFTGDSFTVDAGGKIVIDDYFCASVPKEVDHISCLVLNGTSRTTGHNNNDFRLQNIKSHQPVGSKFRICTINTHNPSAPNILVDGGFIPYDNYFDEHRFQLAVRNPANIKIENYCGLQTGTLWLEDKQFDDDGKSLPPTMMKVYNCRFQGDDMNGDGIITAADWPHPSCPAVKNQRVWLNSRDCFNMAGEPLKSHYVRPMKKGL